MFVFPPSRLSHALALRARVDEPSRRPPTDATQRPVPLAFHS